MQHLDVAERAARHERLAEPRPHALARVLPDPRKRIRARPGDDPDPHRAHILREDEGPCPPDRDRAGPDAPAGGSGRGPLRALNTMLDREWTEPLPILAWAIEHPEGVIVVDTGETARAAEPGYFPRWHPYFRLAVRISVTPDQEIGPALRPPGSAGDAVGWWCSRTCTPTTPAACALPEQRGAGLRTEYEGHGINWGSSAATCRTAGRTASRPGWFDLPGVRSSRSSAARADRGGRRARSWRRRATRTGTVSVVLAEEEGFVFFAGDTSYDEQLMLVGAVDGVARRWPRARHARRIRRFAQAKSDLPTTTRGHEERARARTAGKACDPLSRRAAISARIAANQPPDPSDGRPSSSGPTAANPAPSVASPARGRSRPRRRRCRSGSRSARPGPRARRGRSRAPARRRHVAAAERAGGRDDSVGVGQVRPLEVGALPVHALADVVRQRSRVVRWPRPKR